MVENDERDKSLPDVTYWDDRIRKDYQKIQSFHRKWASSRDLLDNEGEGETYGNLASDFADTVKSRLIGSNFHVQVKADDPDFSKKANEIGVMANSLARTINLKDVLDDATQMSLWANVGWIEIGHSFDRHSLDPHRSVLYKGANQFDQGDTEDNFVPVPTQEVETELGEDIGEVRPFDPLRPPPEVEAPQPKLTFDPGLGAPWTKTLSPFQMVYPPKVVKFEEADYVSKLIIVSRAELKMLTGHDIDKNYSPDKSLFDQLFKDTPGADYISHPVIVAVTFIRRDRNSPEFSSWYLAHVIGEPDMVIKSSPNPYGGMIPLIPAKSRKMSKFAASGWAHTMKPYAGNYGKIIEGVFKRLKRSLNYKWGLPANASLEPTEESKINNEDYSGQIKFKAGSPESFSEIETAVLTHDHIQAIQLIANLAQSASGQTDIDRGSAVKKISARQTEALLSSSSMRMENLRGPVIDAGNEIIMKVIHLLTLFSSPREHVFHFGAKTVSIEPGGNDFTTSYEYDIDVKDLEGPANSEAQLLMVQFLNRVVAIPEFKARYDLGELANEARRAFGFSIAVMKPAESAGGMPGMQNPGQAGSNVLSMGGGADPGVEHPERMLGDQGSAPSVSNALAGVSV